MLAAVELKDFVRQTLLDIAAGLHEANETYKASQISACGTPGSASPRPTRAGARSRGRSQGGVPEGARAEKSDPTRGLVQLGS
jgi:hypothetical protein